MRKNTVVFFCLEMLCSPTFDIHSVTNSFYHSDFAFFKNIVFIIELYFEDKDLSILDMVIL